MRDLWLVLLLPGVAWAAEVSGMVVDAATGQGIGKALVRAVSGDLRSETDAQGRFSLEITQPVELLISCVGYRPYRVRVDPASEVEVRLIPDTLRSSQSVDVTAGPYAVEPVGTGNALSLVGNELRNLASVVADDPLRAVQGLPGVNPNDDFQSQITLRGAGFQRIGIYLDGVLLHSPYHTLQADPTSASLTVLSSDLLESAVLYPSAPPAAFGDRTAAAVDLRLRDGDRKRIAGRGAASASNASISLEGPIGKAGRASWLASARKSYLQYIINATTDEPSLAFGFSDLQGRLRYDASPRHTARISVIHGMSGLDRSGGEREVGLNTFFDTDYQFTIANASSRWTPASSLLVQNSAAWMRETYENRNRERLPLAGGFYGEWIFNSDNVWQWHDGASLGFGGTVRRLRDIGYLDRRVTTVPFLTNADRWRGTGLRSGAHVLQQVSVGRGRLHFRAGGRIDHHDAGGVSTLSPTAGISLVPHGRTAIYLNWGLSSQYPELSQFYSRLGSPRLAAERANAVDAAVEQRLGERTRVRVEAYQRLDRDLVFRPLYEPRLLAGRVYTGNQSAPYASSVRGYARGVQVMVQRRTANGVTGWVSYAYGTSRYRDGVSGTRFPSDFDQRHTVNLFLSYRVRPTVNVSGRWVYGSGFPVRGFYRGTDPAQMLLWETRNGVRLPAYHRMDLRANKTFVRNGWHVTLFAEVINLYNRDNVRYDDVRSVDGRTGSVRLGFDRLLPIVPSAGVAIEF